MLGFEFTGAPSRCYPVDVPTNRALNDRYRKLVRKQVGSRRVSFAGRLANYAYIDMDDCMRQALECADALVSQLPAAARR